MSSKKFIIKLNNEEFALSKFYDNDVFIKMYGHQFNLNNFKGGENAKICNYTSFIKQDNNSIKNLGSGRYGSVHSIIFDKEGRIKFSFKRTDYNKYNISSDQESMPNVEVRMCKYLSENFVYPEICPHFITYIGHNRCKKFMVLLMEQCDTTLENLIISKNRNKWIYNFNHHDWDCILFQVVFSLACLHMHNNYFRHNDLKLDNIFINILKNPQIFYYKWENNYYSFKTKYFVKIGDFGMSCMKGIIDSKSILQGGYNYVGITQEKNRISDIYFFLATIQKFYLKQYKNRIKTKMLEKIMKKVLNYKTNIKTYKDNTHLLEKENKNQNNVFPENLIYLFNDFEINEENLPNNPKIYSTIDDFVKRKSYIQKKRYIQEKKNILKEPVVIINNEIPKNVKNALSNSVKKYYERKARENNSVSPSQKNTLAINLPNLTEKQKRHLVKLINSKTYNNECPQGKIPNYHVIGRCTGINTKAGKEILEIHNLYKMLLEHNYPMKELFNLK